MLSANFSSRACSHKTNMRIFEHKFYAYKAEICKQAVVRQGLLTQYTYFYQKTLFGFMWTCSSSFHSPINSSQLVDVFQSL